MKIKSSFRHGELWPDDHGVHINAHGGGVLFHEGTYYWFGEHKVESEAGNAAHIGDVFESLKAFDVLVPSLAF
jgi:hypothetical protein